MEGSEEISGPLVEIFESSIVTGELPEDWRVANVVLLFFKAAGKSLGTTGR